MSVTHPRLLHHQVRYVIISTFHVTHLKGSEQISFLSYQSFVCKRLLVLISSRRIIYIMLNNCKIDEFIQWIYQFYRLISQTTGTRAFFVAGQTVWNSLPDHLCSPAVDSEQFRRQLKTYRTFETLAHYRCYVMAHYKPTFTYLLTDY